jgi:signal transduction histidine kinase
MLIETYGKLQERRLVGALAAGFCLLLLVGAAAIIAAIASADADYWAVHSVEVRDASARLFSQIQDAETGQRGFILTGDLSYLEPFNIAEQNIPPAAERLRRLITDNPTQQSRLSKIYGLIAQKKKELSHTIDLAQAGKIAEATGVVKSNEGRDLMARIRRDMRDFDQDENRLQTARVTQAAFLRSILLATIVLAVTIAGALAFLVAMGARAALRGLHAQTVALQREIAERQRAESALLHAQKMDALGQLTGGIAHDFNNMLSIIVGNLDLLLRRFTGEDPRTRLYAENALSGARRAADLTRRLLAFSRLQPLKPAPTDINKCVSAMSELLRRTLGEGIEMETVLSGGLWRATVDASQLESAVLNLAINARDATGGAGRLTIETANAELNQAYAEAHHEVTPGQYIMVAVTDTGCGMTEAVINKAFDPFFTTKQPGEGTGLGLSQVHGFAKQSKGHVKLYSEIGKGTTVKLYLLGTCRKLRRRWLNRSWHRKLSFPETTSSLWWRMTAACAVSPSAHCANWALKRSRRIRSRLRVGALPGTRA